MIDELEVMVDAQAGEMVETDDVDETDHIQVQVVVDIDETEVTVEILDMVSEVIDEFDETDITVRIVHIENQIQTDEDDETHYDECID